MASFRNTEAKGAYLEDNDGFGLAFSVAIVSLVEVVR